MYDINYINHHILIDCVVHCIFVYMCTGSEEIMLDLGVKMATKVAQMAKTMIDNGMSMDDMAQMAKGMM